MLQGDAIMEHLSDVVARAKREALVGALRETAGNITLAAAGLGIKRWTFHRLMKAHGVTRHSVFTDTDCVVRPTNGAEYDTPQTESSA